MKRHPLDILQEYFPAGTAEGEQHILPQVFLYWDEYTELMTPAPHSPRLLVGTKGTGKTGVIGFYRSLLERAGVPTKASWVRAARHVSRNLCISYWPTFTLCRFSPVRSSCALSSSP